jgi:hypothetical protein
VRAGRGGAVQTIAFAPPARRCALACGRTWGFRGSGASRGSGGFPNRRARPIARRARENRACSERSDAHPPRRIREKPLQERLSWTRRRHGGARSGAPACGPARARHPGTTPALVNSRILRGFSPQANRKEIWMRGFEKTSA